MAESKHWFRHMQRRQETKVPGKPHEFYAVSGVDKTPFAQVYPESGLEMSRRTFSEMKELAACDLSVPNCSF